jgi:hypothetical protein
MISVVPPAPVGKSQGSPRPWLVIASRLANEAEISVVIPSFPNVKP